MTKKHFLHMAQIVKAILAGEWTHVLPIWADDKRNTSEMLPCDDFQPEQDEIDRFYTRAVQTAEAFIVFARSYNPAFDEHKFLVACGLVQPVKKGRTK